MPQLLSQPGTSTRFLSVESCKSMGKVGTVVDASPVHDRTTCVGPEPAQRGDEDQDAPASSGREDSSGWSTIAIFGSGNDLRLPRREGHLEVDLWDHRQDVARARMTTEQYKEYLLQKFKSETLSFPSGVAEGSSPAHHRWGAWPSPLAKLADNASKEARRHSGQHQLCAERQHLEPPYFPTSRSEKRGEQEKKTPAHDLDICRRNRLQLTQEIKVSAVAGDELSLARDRVRDRAATECVERGGGGRGGGGECTTVHQAAAAGDGEQMLVLIAEQDLWPDLIDDLDAAQGMSALHHAAIVQSETCVRQARILKSLPCSDSV